MDDIYWVATQEMVDWLMTSHVPRIPRSQIALGVGDSPIGYMDPSVATGSLEQRTLPRFSGVATLEAAYNQGKRIQTFTPSVQQIQEGVCAGQSLHWIRRVLQGGCESYKLPEVKGSVHRTDEELARKQRKQHAGGAMAHMLLNQHKDAHQELFNAASRQLNERNVSRLAEADRRIAAFLQSHGFTHNGSGWTFYFWSQAEQQEKQQLLDDVLAWRSALSREMNETVARFNQADSQGFFATGWDKLARDLDEAVRNKLGASKRAYGNILAVRCVNRSDKRFGEGTAEAFAHGLMTDPDFQPGRAALLSVGLAWGIGERGGSISGHAVALHFVAPGELYLFDPNLGVFRCNSTDHMRQALEILLGPVWQEDLQWQLDGTFGYAIFRVAARPADRQPLERVVNFSSEVAEVTTAQNRAIGAVPAVPLEVPATTLTAPPRPRFGPPVKQPATPGKVQGPPRPQTPFRLQGASSGGLPR
jgi:hypothetical protein